LKQRLPTRTYKKHLCIIDRVTNGGDCIKKPLIHNAIHYRQRRLVQVASVTIFLS